LDWVSFLVELVSTLGPLAADPTLLVAGGLTIAGLGKFFAALRKARREKRDLTRELVADAVRQHLPKLADRLDTQWVRIFDVGQDVETVLDRLEQMGAEVRRLQSTAGVDQDVVKVLASRVHEALDALALRLTDDEERLAQLQDIRLRFIPARYTVVRDLDADDAFGRLLRVLDLHPERVYLDHLVPRPGLRDRATPGANTLITGLPGAGKTTLIHQILMRDTPPAVVVAEEGFGSQPDDARWLVCEDLPVGSVLVYDNIQWHAKPFHDIATLLRIERGDIRLLCACRSGDLPRVEREIAGFIESLHITCQAAVPPLTRDEAAQVVALCESSWKIQVEEALREWLVAKGSKAYATPLYFVSLLAPVRARPDRTAHLAEIVALPDEARQGEHALRLIWATYFRQLDDASDPAYDRSADLLRAIRIVHDMELPTNLALVRLIAESFYEIPRADQRKAEKRLRQLLWTVVTDDGRYSCYDIQLAAIDIPPEDHKRFVEWALTCPVSPDFRLTLLNQGGMMQYNRSFTAATHAVRSEALYGAARLWEAGAEACTEEALASEKAMFLNNASPCYADLAQAAASVEERRELLGKAVAAIEEAIRIRRRLNLPADLAGSLNNASNRYADLAQAAESVEERRELLGKAVAAIEEAVGLYRRLNLPAKVATSLNNASNRYADLAQAAASVEERRALLDKAVAAIEEAVGVYRRLNVPAYLAASLNNASGCYAALAEAAASVEERRELLGKAVATIEEAIRIRRRLNLPADLGRSLNNASNLYADLAQAAASVEERRELLGKAVAAIEEAIRIRRRLNLPADLAGSLNNASPCYAALAEAAASVEERRELVGKAVAAIEEAVGLYRRLNLPAYVGASLHNMSARYGDLARGEEDEGNAREYQLRAAAAIDEAISLFERADQKARLLQAYPHGIDVHLPLMAGRPESVARVKEYARKAAPLLRAHGRVEEAEWMEGLLATLKEGG